MQFCGVASAHYSITPQPSRWPFPSTLDLPDNFVAARRRTSSAIGSQRPAGAPALCVLDTTVSRMSRGWPRFSNLGDSIPSWSVSGLMTIVSSSVNRLVATRLGPSGAKIFTALHRRPARFVMDRRKPGYGSDGRVRDSLGGSRNSEVLRDITRVGTRIRAPSVSERVRRPTVCPRRPGADAWGSDRLRR